MNRILIAIAAISICLPLTLKSQDYYIQGVIVDKEQGTTLAGATVLLKQQSENNFKYGQPTDITGFFNFTVKPGKYNLKVTFVGYKSYEVKMNVVDQNVDLGIIELKTNAKTLEQVEIVAQTPTAIVKGDTIQYNASAYKTNPDANAQDLIEKMPGIVVQDGKVQAQGEEVKKVLVDGKTFFGNDPNAALKNIPAEVVDKIEIFDELSEQSKLTGFDDGNTTKTLNIITKEEFRNGSFGNVYGGYGYEDKYSLGGVLNFFDNDKRITIIGQSNNVNNQNFSSEDLVGIMSGSGRGFRGDGGPPMGGRPGGGNDFLVNQQSGITTTHAFGINFNDMVGEKLEINGSYFFNMTENNAKSSIYRQYILAENEGQTYSEDEISESTNINHRFNMRLDYKASDKISILYMPSISFQQNDGISQISGNTNYFSDAVNSTSNEYSSTLTGWNISNELLYRQRFEKTGRSLSLSVNQTNSTKKGDGYLQTESAYFDVMEFDSVDQHSILDQYQNTYSANLRYTEPLTNRGIMMFGYRASFSDNNSNQKTFDKSLTTNEYESLDTLLTNTYQSQYNTQTLNGGFLYRKNKLHMMLGLNYEMANLTSETEFPYMNELSRTYYSFLPMAMIRFRPGSKSNLHIFYRTSTSAPSVDDLQDVLDNSNALQLSIGNPQLEQAYQHNLFAHYSHTNTSRGNMIFLMLSGSTTNDYIGNSLIMATKDTLLENGVSLLNGSQLSQPVNLDGYYTLRSFVTYGMPVSFIKSNLNFNIGYNYSHTPGLLNGIENTSNTQTYEIGLVLSSNISEKFDFTLSSNTSLSNSQNSINTSLNSDYIRQNYKLRFYWNFWKKIVYRTDITYNTYSGLSDDYNIDYFIWNMSLGWKFLKKDKAELNISLSDALNQNSSISRTITEFYIEDQNTNVLQRYFMLNFKYQIKHYRT